MPGLTSAGSTSLYSLMPTAIAPPISLAPPGAPGPDPYSDAPGGPPTFAQVAGHPAGLAVPFPPEPESQASTWLPPAGGMSPQGPAAPSLGDWADLTNTQACFSGTTFPLSSASLLAIASILAEESIAYASARAAALRARYAPQATAGAVQPLQEEAPPANSPVPAVSS